RASGASAPRATALRLLWAWSCCSPFASHLLWPPVIVGECFGSGPRLRCLFLCPRRFFLRGGCKALGLPRPLGQVVRLLAQSHRGLSRAFRLARIFRSRLAGLAELPLERIILRPTLRLGLLGGGRTRSRHGAEPEVRFRLVYQCPAREA